MGHRRNFTGNDTGIVSSILDWYDAHYSLLTEAWLAAILRHRFLQELYSSMVYNSLRIRCFSASHDANIYVGMYSNGYIRTARAKGQKERIVIYRHALRNALLPVITIMGMNFGAMLGGTVTVETVFTLNGVGTLLLASIRSKDIPVVVGAIVIIAVCYTLVMLVVDIAYAFIDPQIKARYLKK